METLKKYFISSALVTRDSKQVTVASAELVPGDIIIVEPGDLIPADIRFFETIDLFVDEAILTGESRSVEKTSDSLTKPPKTLFEAINIGFAATHVVSGMGKGIVIATGAKTAAGFTAKLATETKRISNFEEAMNRFSVFMLRLVVATLLILLVLHVLIKGPDVELGNLLVFFVALAVSVVPEALPVVFTFALSSGAAELAKRSVVVKRLTSIEDLGNIDILCTDKTGTITEGEMMLAQGSEGEERILSIAQMGIGDANTLSNPFDKAIAKAYKKTPSHSKNFTVLERIGFDPKFRLDSTLVKSDSVFVIIRGAPESVASRCDLGTKKQKEIMAWVKEQGCLGRRVLAIAVGKYNETPKNWKEANDLDFVGMLSFEDPLKSTSVKAFEKANALGIKIKIITGDRPEVAGAIAKQIKLISDPGDVITGEELFELSHDKQLEAVQRFFVFARVSPEDKLKIIHLLKEHERVGFLGEGINDAPALKEAHVGIVVQHASDVAREAADIVLLKKSLLVVLEGVEHGRKVSANTVKYIKTTLASNFGNFYSVAIASLFIPYLPMLPIQILLLNLLSDFPMIAIASDTVEADELSKPKGMNLHEIGFLTTFFGTVSSVFDFLVFGMFVGYGSTILQTAWFIESILTELFAIISLRTRKWFFLTRAPGRVLSILIVGATAITIALPSFAVTRELFGFAKLSKTHFIVIACIIVSYFIATEFTKRLYYRITDAHFAKVSN